MDLVGITIGLVQKTILDYLKDAHFFYVNYRVGTFLNTLNSEIEYLSTEDRKNFNEYLERPETKKVLADYASAITSTSSDIVLRALALTFINDRQFDFSESEKIRFISCINGLDDLKVNLYIRLASLKKLESKAVYPIYVIGNKNFDSLNLAVDVDEFFAYCEDFFNRGLLLRKPLSTGGFNFHIPEDGDWSISFGISDTLKKFASTLRKAKELTSK
ncbi:TPA: hypothetical protein ACX6PR_002094 [Photobacterium damselae]